MKIIPVFSVLVYLIILFVLCFFLSSPVIATDDLPMGNTTKTLLACYFVGNDIESDNLLGDYGFITQNLLDMREGYGEGRPGELTVIIAYGGADKEGWRGMRVYSLENATADLLDDGVYNEWDSYTLSFPDYNMGSKDSFRQFLSLLLPYRDADRKYLIMSGHGGAYKGAFPDENYDTGNIPLSDMSSALSESGLHFDILGMDTCLMGALEVAESVRKNADYLLASEETEPSRGWNYSVITSKLVEDPHISPEELGKAIIETYSQYQIENSPGTLSLIDLRTIPAVTESLDLFSRQLSEMYKDPVYKKKIQEIMMSSGEFGLEFYLDINSDTELFASYTMDLLSCVRDLGHAIPELHDDADHLVSAIEKAVLLHTEQKRPYASGLSIFSPVHKEVMLEHIFEYSPSIAVSEEWYTFLIQYFRSVLSDKEKPFLNETDKGLQVSDTSAVTVGIEFVRNNPDCEVILGSELTYPDAAGYYHLPEWDGRAFHLFNTTTGEIQIIPVFFQRQVDSETEEYYSFARLSPDYDPLEPWICIDIFFNNRTGETTLFFIYIGTDEEGIISMAHSGRLYSLADMDGIGIVPYAVTEYQSGNRIWKPVGVRPFMLGNATSTRYETVACGEYHYYLVAEDSNGNRAVGEKKRLSIPC